MIFLHSSVVQEHFYTFNKSETWKTNALRELSNLITFLKGMNNIYEIIFPPLANCVMTC